MRKDYDEPIFLDIKKRDFNGSKNKNPEKEIRTLCENQPFAVLATQGNGMSDASLISFATSGDLACLVFATPRNTEKFRLIESNPLVSILIDNRTDLPESINQIMAMTINGNARILVDDQEIAVWTEILAKKHPYLTGFIEAPTTAIILVEANHYFLVGSFQEVFEWSPIRI